MASTADLAAAEQFMLHTARILDRRRWALRFSGGPAGPALDALRAYRNPDGGFGNALEPDLRGPDSQPLAAWHAAMVLAEADALGDPMLAGLLDWLAGITRPDGGVPFMLPSGLAHPRAPWWQTGEDPPGSLLATGLLVAELLRHGVEHPWLDGAAAFCWHEIDALGETDAYTAISAVAFLDAAPDRDRAARAVERAGRLILDQKLVALDPDERGEVHFPLAYAPRPDSIGRRLFDDATIERHLDAMVAAQQPDGGWTFNFPVWTPATEAEWRGVVTFENATTLQAYGRASATA
jgi:hypothetical protein